MIMKNNGIKNLNVPASKDVKELKIKKTEQN